MNKKDFDVGFLCEQEARAGDETMYVITMLQAKLDRAKIQNHVALLQLADKVELQMRMEDLNYYKMNEKICLGANNYLKSAAASDILNANASASGLIEQT